MNLMCCFRPLPNVLVSQYRSNVCLSVSPSFMSIPCPVVPPFHEPFSGPTSELNWMSIARLIFFG